MATGHYDEAEKLFRRSLGIYEKHLGPDHAAVAAAVNNLAYLFLETGQYARAEPLFQRALRIKEKAVGPNHEMTATGLHNLAELYRRMHRYDEAEALHARSLKIHEKVFGPDHPETATCLTYFAELYVDRGDFGPAELLYRRAQGITEKRSGADSLEASAGLTKLAMLYEKMGQYPAAAEARQLLAGGEGGMRGPGGVSAALRNARWPRLPGTAAEGKAVAARLAAYARGEPAVRTGKDALESAVKRAVGPRLLVFCTHAFFVEGPAAAGAPAFSQGERGLRLVTVHAARAETKPAPPPENPLLRCGLVLAGANSRPDAAAGRALDDGLLTGLEIVGLDLRGTELVVLRACESGVGVVRAGEGVAGLRQAFQLAGAESVLATLWRIPDRETAQVMEAFFDHLAAGEGKAAALRGAQLDWIKQRRGRAGAAHPFFWAAFALTGG
jgi:hypothetical protein